VVVPHRIGEAFQPLGPAIFERRELPPALAAHSLGFATPLAQVAAEGCAGGDISIDINLTNKKGAQPRA
jgi:hypothetical protein